MKNYACFVCCILTCFLSFGLFAQGENNNWCFGRNLQLSFNTNPPTFSKDSMEVQESSSSVSDAAGNLLFYTSGANVWDRNHNHMPNGIDMAGNGPLGPIVGQNSGSSSCGVAVIPSPTNSNQYYIVTTDTYQEGIHKAYYSVVDMTLNGGLGDVVAGQKSIVFATGVSEGVIVGRAVNCTGYWVIVHRLYGPDYLSFRIDTNGFSTVPVTSSGIIGASDTLEHYGTTCLNSASNRLARCSIRTETGSFDNISGVLSGFVIMDTTTIGFHPIFSPDGSKLYCGGGRLYQYDMSLLPDGIAVQNSKILIDSTFWGRSRLGPGGKIYTLSPWQSHLGRIDNPNNAGLACGFVANALAMPPVAIDFFELGSDVLINTPADTIIHVLDTMLCSLSEVTLSADPSRPNHLWSTGSTSIQERFSQSGTYWVYSATNCRTYIDTFHLRFTAFEVSLGNDTSLCAGDNLLLDVSTDGAGYVWQDGATGPTYTVDKEGVYSVSVNKGPCTLSDTVVVDIIHPSLDIPEQDSTICKGEPVTLHALGIPENNYLWSTGSAESSILIDGAGTYTVQATTICGVMHDSVRIAEEICNCDAAFVPNAFSPNGDGRNDILEVRLHCPRLEDYAFTIYNRYGQKMYESAWPGQGWDGYHNGSLADMGTYFFYLRYKENTGKETIKRGDIILLR